MTGIVSAVIRKSETRKGGYGFILDETHTERFFHASNLRDITFEELREGTRVEFEPFSIPGKGDRAEDVRVLPR